MAKPKKIDWEGAKGAYIGNQSMSLKEVAKEYKMGYGSLRNISTSEGWVADKKRRWAKQEKEALEEIEGSIKDLIIRHAKVARFLQAGGVKRLQKRLRELDLVDENPRLGKKVRQMDDRTLITLVSEGLKAERELYPKQMQIDGDVKLQIGEVSDELKKAANEALKKQLTERRRTRKDNRGKQK